MLTEANGKVAPGNMRLKEKNSELESIFKTVDILKRDLSNCGRGITDAAIQPFNYGDYHFSCMWMEDDALVTAGYWWNNEAKTLSRKYGNRAPEIIMRDVTDFYISHFTASSSILYRLEINNKEQIRGYIFLTNLANKKLKEEHDEPNN